MLRRARDKPGHGEARVLPTDLYPFTSYRISFRRRKPGVKGSL